MSPRQCRLVFFVFLFLFALLPGVSHADVGHTGMAQPVEPAAASRKSLRLTVDAPAAPLALGDEATLTIVVTNDSAEPVENVLLYLAQEPGIEWVEPAGGPWLALGTLAAGETRTTVARLRVVGTHRSGQLRFTVGVTGDDAKPQRERVSLLVPRMEPETANVPAAGGEVSFARGRVRLAFPPGWNEQDAQLSFQLEELYKQKHKERGRLLLFTLTATAGGAPVDAFDAPVAIMLDVADLVAGDAAEPIPTVSTAPTIEESWATVPSSFDPAAGTLSFSAEHFSAFQTTTDPQLWKLAYNPPGASPYTGAATYSYPIDLPPGIGGLTPDLTLSYSSRAAEGLSYPAMGQGFGAGWALPQAQINNGNSGLMYGDKNGGCSDYGNWRFTLVLNGATYYLKPQSGAVTGDRSHGRYQAIGSPELLIEYVADDNGANNTDNISGEFWRVRTADGTTYTFGHAAGAEQVVWPVSTTVHCNGYQPRNPAFSAYNWKLDSITDVHGNQITYSYKTACGRKDTSPYADRGENANGSFQCSEVDVSLETVRYNVNGGAPQTTATFGYQEVNEGVRRKAASMIAGVLRPQSLQVHHNGVKVGSYAFTYDEDAHWYDPWPASTEFWWLTGITRMGVGNATLPAQTFTYAENTARGCRDGVCVKLLASASNGYGAVSQITYGALVETGWRYVTTIDTWDGVIHRFGNHRPQTRLRYTPSVTRVNNVVQLCYDKDFHAQNNPCYSEMGSGEGSEALVGFNTTAVETQAPSGANNWTTQNKTTLTFYNVDFWLLGKTDLQEQFAANGDKLQRSDYHWTRPDLNLPHVFLDWEAHATFQPGDVNTYIASLTDYEYYPVNPGNGHFGGLKWKLEKDEAGRAYRCTEYAYVHKTDTTWLINRPARETVKSGGCAGTRQAETLYRYAPSAFPGDTSLDARGLLTYILRWSPRGMADYYATEKIEYNAQGLPRVVTMFSDLSSASTYIGSGSVRNTTTTTYTPLGLPQTITTSAANIFDQTQTIGYDTTLPWLVSSVTDANNIVTRYGYDAFGRLSTVAAPGDTLGAPTMTHAYSDGPAPWRIQTTYKNTVRNAERQYYDGLGRLVQSQTDNAEVEGAGDRDIVVSYAYDARGLEVCRSVPYPVAAGSNSFQTAACASVTTTTTAYDALGRVTSVTTPNGVAETTYNVSQNITVGGGSYGPARSTLMLTSYFDAADQRVNQYHDVFGRLVLVREFTGNAAPYTPYADTRYGYDERDNLTRVGAGPHNNSQPGSFERETTMSYDELGRKTGMTDPDMGTWSYDYDDAGNLISQKASDNQVICFYYDNLNRVLRRAANNASTNCPTYTASPASGANHLASYRYGGNVGAYNNGRLIEVNWGLNPTANKDTFAYDNEGRLSQQNRLVAGRSFSFQPGDYDEFDRPRQRTMPDGEVVAVAYDHEGENTLTAGGTPLIAKVGYNERGQLAYLERTSGPATTFAYHGTGADFGRLSLIRHGTASDAYPDYSYSGYDSVGNLTGVTVTNANAGSYAYTYDDLNRLATATLSGAGAADFSYTYSYNRLGNLTGRTGTDPDMTYAYGAGSAGPQAVTSITRSVGDNLAFTYDPRGNMDGQSIGATLVYDYTFDVEGRLASVMTNNQTTTFAYDADGQRVLTTRPDGTIIYTPFPDYELEDPLGANNDTTRTTYRLAGQMVGLRVKTPTGNTVYYPFTDHLGNVVAMSWRGAGVVPNSHALYDPFGNFRTAPTATNPSLTSRGFTGHAHNNTGVYPTQNVGLIYMNARYYLPEVGRFISADTIVPDPTNPQSHNRYAYALNSPVSFTDTTGHCVEPVTATVVCIPTALVVGAVLTVAYVGIVVADLVSPTFNPRDDLADAATDALTELYDNIKYAASGDNGDVTGSEEVRKSLGGAGSASPNPDPNDPNNIPSADSGRKPRSEPQALRRGNQFHYDQLNGGTGSGGPTQLQNMYPDTEFQFARRGQAGPDVSYVRGPHPSQYPGSSWPSWANHGDFKPNTPYGLRSFFRDIRSGKLPFDSTALPYDSGTMNLSLNHYFGSPWP